MTRAQVAFVPTCSRSRMPPSTSACAHHRARLGSPGERRRPGTIVRLHPSLEIARRIAIPRHHHRRRVGRVDDERLIEAANFRTVCQRELRGSARQHAPES